MSQENVEVVRAGIDAFNREGDWEPVFKKYAGPSLEFDMSRSIAPQRGVYGREETPQVLSELTEGFESVQIEPHEFIEVGEHVVVPWTAHMVGRDGIEVEARWPERTRAKPQACTTAAACG